MREVIIILAKIGMKTLKFQMSPWHASFLLSFHLMVCYLTLADDDKSPTEVSFQSCLKEKKKVSWSERNRKISGIL